MLKYNVILFAIYILSQYISYTFESKRLCIYCENYYTYFVSNFYWNTIPHFDSSFSNAIFSTMP